MKNVVRENLFGSVDELEVYAELIQDSISSIRMKEVKILEEINPLILAYKATIGLQQSVGKFKPLTATACSIGQLVLVEVECVERENISELNPEYYGVDDIDDILGERYVNKRRLKAGYHLINVLIEARKLKLQRGRWERDPYFISPVDKDFIDRLFYVVDVKPLEVPTYARPLLTRPIPFTSFYHKVSGELVRRAHPDAITQFKYDNVPLVFDAINKHMNISYNVNTSLLDVYNTLKEDDIFTLKAQSLSDEQREGMLREINAVLNISKGLGERTFWESMFYDSRGRMYSSSTYFTHQGSKLSKSLFLLNDKVELGEYGWRELLIHAANSFGEDKKPLQERYEFAEDRLDEWMVWAEDPIANKDWQHKDIDDSYGFLAVIMDIRNALSSEDKYKYKSGIITAQDASCSGLQHLSAMTGDKIAGKLCNIVDLDGGRGDYYEMIGGHVSLDCVYTEEEFKTFEEMRDGTFFQEHEEVLRGFSKRIRAEKNKQLKEVIKDEKEAYMVLKRPEVDLYARVFWGRDEMLKLMRSTVKRPCMTYFYSCGVKTMSKQLLRDKSISYEYAGINSYVCFWICHRIYKSCRLKMPIATEMMDALMDLGLKEYFKGKDFIMSLPYTGFIMSQYYRGSIVEKVKVPYKNRWIKLGVVVGKDSKLDYQKIKSSISPNKIHGFDGQQVALATLRTEYNLVCIHDSFGCAAGNATRMRTDIRECFIEMYSIDVIKYIGDQKDFTFDIVKGDLDITDVRRNDFFCS